MKINKKIKTLDFKLSKILNGGLFGAYKSKFSGNGMEFSEHKEYHFGDHVKNIDWKASSKTGEMYVKKYEEERDLNVLFFIDNTKSMEFGSNDITKKDLLIDVFYSLSLSAYYNNDNIGGVVYNEDNIEFINYKKSRENIYKIINFLDEKNKSENYFIDNKINKFLKYILSKKIKNTLVFILTDSTDKVNEKLLRLINSDNEVVIINIFDYFENNLSDLLGDFVLGNGNSFLNIDLSKEGQLEKYRKFRKNKLEYLKKSIEKNKAGYMKIDTKSDIFKELMGYFSKIKN